MGYPISWTNYANAKPTQIGLIMDAATLLISHFVLSLGSIREAARALDRPSSTVSAALARLQSQIATPLATTDRGRIFPTLEGRRLAHDLKHAATQVVELAGLSADAGDERPEIRAARLSVSLLALSRFLTVVRKGSIRAAAGDRGIGQPQLTRQLKALENGLCVQLFDRSAAGAVPTPAGLKLAKIADRLDAIWGRMSDASGQRFRRSIRTINLGSVTPLGRESRIAQILALLAAEWPRVQPQSPLFISSTNSEELLAGLKSKVYDVALLESVEIPAGMDHNVIFRSNLAIAGLADVLAAQGKDLRSLLLYSPIALPSLKSGLRQKFEMLIENVLPPAERTQLSFIEVDSIPVIANLLLEHGYISLLPEWAISGMNDLDAIALPSAYDIHLLFAWRKNSAAEEVASLLQDILRAHQF